MIEARDSADATFAITRGAAAVASNDFIIFSQLTPAYFGDGSDGAAVFDGAATPTGTTKNSATSYTLNRDVYYTSATVSTGVTVSTNGYRFFCTATLTLTGTASLDNSGNAGGAGGLAAAGTAGATAVSNVVGGNVSNAGGAGGLAGAGAAGQPQTNNSWGGAGGGGQAGTAGAGGGAGAVSRLASSNPSPSRVIPDLIVGATQTLGGTSVALRYIQGGGGGGGGGGGTTNGGGGGASGGGVLVVCVKTITGSGNLSANGGAGGAHAGTGGDGGGGGGGFVALLYHDKSGWTGAAQVNGGASTGGTAGSVGSSVLLQG